MHPLIENYLTYTQLVYLFVPISYRIILVSLSQLVYNWFVPSSFFVIEWSPSDLASETVLFLFSKVVCAEFVQKKSLSLFFFLLFTTWHTLFLFQMEPQQIYSRGQTVKKLFRISPYKCKKQKTKVVFEVNLRKWKWRRLMLDWICWK